MEKILEEYGDTIVSTIIGCGFIAALVAMFIMYG